MRQPQYGIDRSDFAALQRVQQGTTTQDEFSRCESSRSVSDGGTNAIVCRKADKTGRRSVRRSSTEGDEIVLTRIRPWTRVGLMTSHKNSSAISPRNNGSVMTTKREKRGSKCYRVSTIGHRGHRRFLYIQGRRSGSLSRLSRNCCCRGRCS